MDFTSSPVKEQTTSFLSSWGEMVLIIKSLVNMCVTLLIEYTNSDPATRYQIALIERLIVAK